jgi:hypothetical protein
MPVGPSPAETLVSRATAMDLILPTREPDR